MVNTFRFAKPRLLVFLSTRLCVASRFFGALKRVLNGYMIFSNHSAALEMLQKRLAAQGTMPSGTCVSLVNLGFAQIHGLNDYDF
jgi:hypothetical protein